MSEESSSRKKTKTTRVAAADEDSRADASPTDPRLAQGGPVLAPTDPRLAPTDPRLVPTDPRLAPTDPRLAPMNKTAKEAGKERDASMQGSSNITVRKRTHQAENAPTSSQVASQVNAPIAPPTIQELSKSKTDQSASKEKDKDSEIEDLKEQVQYWRDQADLTQRLTRNNCQLSSTNAEQERLIGALERENTLLKTRNEKLEKDLATEKEETVKMKIETAVANRDRDLMEKRARDLTEELEDVKKMLSCSKANEDKMEGRVEVLSAEREQAHQRVLQLYKEKEELVEQLKEVKAEAKLAAKSQKSRVALEEELAKLQLDVNKHMSEKKEIREEKVKLREKYEALKKEKRSAWEFWGVALRNVAGTLSNGGSENQAVKTNEAQQLVSDEFSLKLESLRISHDDQVNTLQRDVENLREKHEEEKKKMEELHRNQIAALQDQAKNKEAENLEKEQEIMKDDLQKEIENLMEGSVPADFGKHVGSDQEGGSGAN